MAGDRARAIDYGIVPLFKVCQPRRLTLKPYPFDGLNIHAIRCQKLG